MRTELKIGVTVVLVVSVMVLVYFVFFANRGETPRPPQNIAIRTEPNRAPAAPARGTLARGTGRSTTPPGPLVVTPPAPAPAPTPTTSPVTTRPAPVETIVETPRTPVDSTVASRTEPPATTLLPSVALPGAARLESNRAPVRPEPSGFTPTPIYASGAGRVETIAPPSTVVDDRTSPVLSTVRPGTAEANVAHPAAATGTGLVRKADGKDYYTVQKDDKGYWGIAAKPFVYGDGRKWDLIQKANPGVEPSKLRAGQELVIPSAPVAAAGTSTTRPAVALTSATRPAGSSAYSVKQNDSLASIAKAKYGVEALWHEIAKANPSVDPAHLRIGQELVLPSAEDARRAAGMSAVATTGPAVAPLSVSPAAPVAPTSRPALARHTSPTPAPDRTRTTATPPARTTGGWD